MKPSPKFIKKEILLVSFFSKKVHCRRIAVHFGNIAGAFWEAAAALQLQLHCSYILGGCSCIAAAFLEHCSCIFGRPLGNLKNCKLPAKNAAAMHLHWILKVFLLKIIDFMQTCT